MFSYIMTAPWGDQVVGIVIAMDMKSAKELVRKTYSDCDAWRVTIKEIKFDKNIKEIYYG